MCNSLKRTGKLLQGLSFCWSVFVLVLLLVIGPRAWGQEAGSSDSSSVGSTQSQAIEPRPNLPDLPIIAPLAIPSGTTPLQEAMLRLKKWDERWQAEMIWREQVAISWQAMLNSYENMKKADNKALADKTAEADGWKLTADLRAKQLADMGTTRTLEAISSFLLGGLAGYGVGKIK